MSLIDENLSAMGITLEAATPPLANYMPFLITGNLLFISGQLPMKDGIVQYTGHLGSDIGIVQGQSAAKLCAINILQQAKSALGNFYTLERCVKLGGFVNATPDFNDHATIMNGASDFIVKAMGDNGRHARAAVGVASLPLNATVEVEAIFQIDA